MNTKFKKSAIFCTAAIFFLGIFFIKIYRIESLSSTNLVKIKLPNSESTKIEQVKETKFLHQKNENENLLNKLNRENNISSISLSFKNAKDFRIFSTNAIRHPDQGGITYAAYASSICRTAKTLLSAAAVNWDGGDLPYQAPEDPTRYAARNSAFKNIKFACGTFSAQEESSEQDVDLLLQAKKQNDVLQHLGEKVDLAINSGDPAQKKVALSLVLENGDPLLISNKLERLLLQNSPQGLVYTFDGNSIAMKDAAVLRAALMVLPCQLGLLCDGRTPEVLQRCIGSGDCYADKVEMVRAELPVNQRDEFNRTLILLTDAVRQQRVDTFL